MLSLEFHRIFLPLTTEFAQALCAVRRLVPSIPYYPKGISSGTRFCEWIDCVLQQKILLKFNKKICFYKNFFKQKKIKRNRKNSEKIKKNQKKWTKSNFKKKSQSIPERIFEQLIDAIVDKKRFGVSSIHWKIIIKHSECI